MPARTSVDALRPAGVALRDGAMPMGASKIAARLAGGWRLLRRGARAALDKIPVTWLSLLLAVDSAVAVLYYGQKRLDVVLYVAGLGIGLLVVAAQLFVSLATVLLWLTWRRLHHAP